jgi:hypothetical protein
MDQNRRGKAGQPRGARAHPAKISPATYWRRRVLVLAVGIGLLTALSWAANGMLAARSTADQAGHTGRTEAAGSTPAHVERTPSGPSPSPSPSKSPVPSQHASTAQSHASGPAPACAPADVTLRLSSPQYWYQMGKTPRFTVHAVSQNNRPCRFNMGTKFVSVVIAAHGQRVWSSADCVSGGGSNMIVLTGTPAVVRVSWDRRTSSPGCGGTGQSARPGEYQVTAVAGHLHSTTVNVVLGAQGASGP